MYLPGLPRDDMCMYMRTLRGAGASFYLSVEELLFDRIVCRYSYYLPDNAAQFGWFVGWLVAVLRQAIPG